MKKPRFIILFIFCYSTSWGQGPVLKDLLKLTTDSLKTTQQQNLWLADSTIYANRLKAIKTEMPLVYNKQVQKYISIYTGSRKKEMCAMVEQGEYYFPIFEKALKAYNIPDAFKYIPIIESGLNAFAVSKSGATGLWQFMYGTGKHCSLQINRYVDERKDPIKASYAAAKHLRELYTLFGDWFLVLAAYNSGSGAIKRSIINAGGTKNYWKLQPFLSKQAQKYIPAFIATTYVMLYPNHYKITATNTGAVYPTDTLYINKHLNLKKLGLAINVPQHKLLNLNPSYIKGIINGTVNIPQRLIIPQLKPELYSNLYATVYQNTWPQTLHLNLPLPIQTLAQKPTENQQKIIPEETTNTPQNSETSSDYLNYTVKIGDTLFNIVSRFKHLTVAKIQEINQLKNNSVLNTGCILKIACLSN